LGVQPLIIDSVACFVQCPEEGVVKVVGMESRGDPAIPRPNDAAKRMRRHIESAGLELEADGLGGRLADSLLLLDGKVPAEYVARSALTGNDGLHQRHKLLP